MSPVYLIGGASASGKSSAAKLLAQRFELPIVHQDDFHNVLRPLIASRTDLDSATEAVSSQAARHILSLGQRCIIEGGWIDPDGAVRLFGSERAKLSTVYCGYTADDLEGRLSSIACDGKHWLAKRPRIEALEFLETQASGSNWYQRKCEESGIRYIDFTSFDVGARNLTRHFKAWFDAGASDA